jgi:hypothetical protein
MSTQVKVKVQAGETLHFPGICVHCSRPAVQWMSLKKPKSRLMRRIDIPVCGQCAAVLGRSSWQEERLLKMGRITAGLIAVLIWLLTFFLLFAPLPLALRLPLSFLAAGLAAYDVWAFAQRKGLAAALPEKKSILAAAQIADFSWRATTFEFRNPLFAEKFVDLNRGVTLI